LDDFVLQGCDAKRPQASISLRDVNPSTRLCPVTPTMDSTAQLLEVGSRVFTVPLPHDSIDSRRSLRLKALERPGQTVLVEMMMQRSELHLLVPERDLAHTLQPEGHSIDLALRPGSARYGRGPWWNAGASHMNGALPTAYFRKLGLVSLMEEVQWLTLKRALRSS
jgi:hypothetical protein